MGRTVILVDDGLAIGTTLRAAIRALRGREPARIVAAVPVAAPETCAAISEEADEAVCAARSRDFHAVGFWYENFSQTSDEEVRALLEAARSDAFDASDSPTRRARQAVNAVARGPSRIRTWARPVMSRLL